MTPLSSRSAAATVVGREPFRILHIISSVNPAGGGPIEGIIRQDEALKGFGRREIVSCDPPDAPFLQDFPIQVHALGLRLPAVLAKRIPKSEFGFTPRLIPWLRANASNYDAIVVNGVWNFGSVASSIVLPQLGTPYFVFTHGMLSGWFRKNFPIKHILKQIFWLLFDGRLLSCAKAVLFTTEDEAAQAHGQFAGHRYQSQVVGYGTTPPPLREGQKQAFLATQPVLLGRRYLLFLGRIHPIKGCDLLLEAFARCAQEYQDLDLVIAGPDPGGMKENLRRAAHRLGVSDRVYWPGMLSGDLKWGAICGSAAFILPSHHENFGIVAAEALACAKPVLITNKVAIHRDIAAAGAGLVGHDDVAGIESLIRRFEALTDVERENMSSAAADIFRSNYDFNVVAHRVLDTLRNHA